MGCLVRHLDIEYLQLKLGTAAQVKPMNNAANNLETRISINDAIKYVFIVTAENDRFTDAPEVAYNASLLCRQRVLTNYVRDFTYILESQGWTFARRCGKLKALTTGKG